MAPTNFSPDDFSEDFKESLSNTENAILKQLIKLNDGDASKALKILRVWQGKISGLLSEKMWPTEEPLEEVDYNDRYFSEHFLSLAFFEFYITRIWFDSGDLSKALGILMRANRFLGMSQSLNPSKDYKERKKFAEDRAKTIIATAGRVQKYADNEAKLKQYWKVNIGPTIRPSTAARLLERSAVFEARVSASQSSMRNFYEYKKKQRLLAYFLGLQDLGQN